MEAIDDNRAFASNGRQRAATQFKLYRMNIGLLCKTWIKFLTGANMRVDAPTSSGKGQGSVLAKAAIGTKNEDIFVGFGPGDFLSESNLKIHS